MFIYAEVVFYSGKRKSLPKSGYRPDAVFNSLKDYWGITFLDLSIEDFDMPTPAIFKFSFDNLHYKEITLGQTFQIMEGPHQVGKGKIISIETDYK